MKLPQRFLLALFVLVLISYTALAAQADMPQIRISTLSRDCSNPRLALNPGGDLCVVWQGMLQGRSRIFFRQKRQGLWEKEVLVDQSHWGNQSDPAIALDPQGRPLVCWSSSDPEASAIHFALLKDQQWIQGDPIRVSRDLNCEFPQMACDRQGRIFIVWQEGRGSLYSIFCAFSEAGGEFQSLRISSESSRGYNLFPSIFLAPTPLITWYGMKDSDFCLQASLLNIQTDQWLNFRPAGLENLPANRFPFLIAGDDGRFHATWYDSDGSSDRILWASQDDSDLGAGFIVDDNPERMNNLPRGALGDGRIFLCWRGESIFGGQIFLTSPDKTRILGEDGRLIREAGRSRLVSDGQNLFYTQPDCAVEPGGSVCVVWVSSIMDGGNGAVYLRRILP